MKIGVIGASGRVGGLVTKELIKRGYYVTAIVRDKKKVKEKNINIIEKDILKLEKNDVKNFDVVVDAFGIWKEDELYLHFVLTKHLCDILSNTDTRLLIVGGAGSLYVDKEHTTMLYETKDFPKEFKPLATQMGKALTELRKRDDIKWTYISPAADFRADGEKKDNYILSGEEFMVNDEGISAISYVDYATALVDEIERGNHIKKRISVLWK